MTFVGSRLKGGEMLIRKVTARGPGLVLDAAGRRTVLGNLQRRWGGMCLCSARGLAEDAPRDSAPPASVHPGPRRLQ